eukprot:3361099-Rhodomonas_salina.5
MSGTGIAFAICPSRTIGGVWYWHGVWDWHGVLCMCLTVLGIAYVAGTDVAYGAGTGIAYGAWAARGGLRARGTRGRREEAREGPGGAVKRRAIRGEEWGCEEGGCEEGGCEEGREEEKEEMGGREEKGERKGDHLNVEGRGRRGRREGMQTQIVCCV